VSGLLERGRWTIVIQSEIVKWIIIIAVLAILILLFASMVIPLSGLGYQNPFFGVFG
jgi:hypothetical protein